MGLGPPGQWAVWESLSKNFVKVKMDEVGGEVREKKGKNYTQLHLVHSIEYIKKTLQIAKWFTLTFCQVKGR